MSSTQTSKLRAMLNTVVELAVDRDEFVRGQRGIVISEFETPEEAYDLEMQGEDGGFLGFAYSVKPNELRII